MSSAIPAQALGSWAITSRRRFFVGLVKLDVLAKQGLAEP